MSECFSQYVVQQLYARVLRQHVLVVLYGCVLRQQR
jgi:hypothetical protein